jgi:hypothetical protein
MRQILNYFFSSENIFILFYPVPYTVTLHFHNMYLNTRNDPSQLVFNIPSHNIYGKCIMEQTEELTDN